jgi:uncharacterized membrane protein YoaK (UPF0700 family)
MLQHHIHCLFSNSSEETALPSFFNLVAFEHLIWIQIRFYHLSYVGGVVVAEYICKFFGRIRMKLVVKVLRSN